MVTWKQPLEEYQWLIYQVWYLEVEEGDALSHQPLLIPNPRCHLVISPPDQTYHYSGSAMESLGSGSHLLTVIDQPLKLGDSAPLKRLGITFQPGALYRLYSDASTALNRCGWFPWLESLLPSPSHEMLLSLQSSDQVLPVLRQHLDGLVLNQQADGYLELTTRVLSILEQHEGLTSEELAQQCHCSKRTLERGFKRVTGLTLKQYQVMLRLERLVLKLYALGEDELEWADLAQEYGFTDQPHLIRHLRQLLGKTPGSYLKARDLTIDIYGDFD